MPGTKPLRTLSCATCGESPARWYFLGARCPEHAPTERQVVDHAVARLAERNARDSASRETATSVHPARETR